MNNIGIIELLSTFGVSIGGLITVFVNMYTTNKVQNEKIKNLELRVNHHSEKINNMETKVIDRLELMKNEIHELSIKIATIIK